MVYSYFSNKETTETSPALQQRGLDKSYSLGRLHVPGLPFLHFSLINTYEEQTIATHLRAEDIKINMTLPSRNFCPIGEIDIQVHIYARIIDGKST